jgi:hypothetical protein
MSVIEISRQLTDLPLSTVIQLKRIAQLFVGRRVRIERFVQVSVLALLGTVAALGLCEKAYAQCGLPELVEGGRQVQRTGL